jgi:hypothetical protein
VGFLGCEWQTQIFDRTNNLLWTPQRKNQHYQHPNELERWLSSVRERIEGVFHEIQNIGCNIERLLAKTMLGFCTRITAKMTVHLLRHLLLTDFGVHVQNFRMVEPV